VEIEFKDRRLRAASQSVTEAGRQFGVPIGRKYIQRLAVLRATERFSELFGHRALRLHSLHGNREGQFAMTLTGNLRLIVEQLAADRVRILEVEDYHGN
jgi:proteic killer suppression protein